MWLPTGIILFLCLSLTSAELSNSTVNATSPRNCYSCRGINCQRTNRQNETVVCNDLLDICVTIYDGFRVSERGCLLELSQAGQSKCETWDKQCQKCSGQLCNNLGRSDFRCIQCTGSENSNCNSAASSVSASQCSAPTSSNAYCYVKVVGENLQRGCALSVREQQSCLEDSSCSLCLPENALESSACNNYDLNYRSGAARGQLLFGLLLSMLGLLSVQGLH